jgi:hypothetical protein
MIIHRRDAENAEKIHYKNRKTVKAHDRREKVRPGTGREAGLGHAGGRVMHGAVTERT